MSNNNNEKHHDGFDNVGTFAGFVLLDEAEWDKEQFLADFEEDWDIELEDENSGNETPEEANRMVFAKIDDYIVTVAFVDIPVPNNEAEYWAKANYMWREAEDVVSTHKAQLIVSVLGNNDDLLDKGELFVKLVCSALKQDNAIAFYNEGAVFSPKQYLDFSGMMDDDGYPILNWIWFGIYADENKAGVYTYGMHRMGKDEIEVYVDRSKADLNDIRGFLLDIVSYVICEDVTLKDGETIGFSEEQKLKIELSDGIALDGKTLKIEYGE